MEKDTSSSKRKKNDDDDDDDDDGEDEEEEEDEEDDEDDEEEEEEKEEEEDEAGPLGRLSDILALDLKMVLLVRRDLKMTNGKVAAQCCHACLGAYRVAQRKAPLNVRKWRMIGEKKIALSVQSEEEVEELKRKAREAGLPHYLVQDAGHTQVAAGSKTVLAIGPAPSSAINAITGSLKLY